MADGTIPIPKRDLSGLREIGDDTIDNAMHKVLPYLKEGLTVVETGLMRRRLIRLRSQFQAKWKQSRYRNGVFENQNIAWLESLVNVPRDLIRVVDLEPVQTSSRGKMQFGDKGRRAQNIEIAKVSDAQTEDTVPLVKATSRTVKKRGLTDMAAIIKETAASPNRPAKMKKRLSDQPAEIESFSPNEALALILDLSLTRDQYAKLRKAFKAKGGNNLFPAYGKVLHAKEDCRPEKETCDFNDTEAVVPLQNLLDHTARRLVKVQHDVILSDMKSRNLTSTSIILLLSWGFDGSTGQSNYKQRPSQMHHEDTVDDSSLFATTVNPLQLLGENKQVYWHNRRPQSVDLCRPLRLQFTKETKQMVIRTREEIEKQIQSLLSCRIQLDENCFVSITYNLRLTMIDGKILNFLTDTLSMQTCPLCKATPSEFNKLCNRGTSTFAVNSMDLAYGISPLHAWIRFFELCLHLSYKLDVKKWKIPKEGEDRLKIEARKKYIQDTLRIELNGIIVDKPKSGGSGSTNDGNTARRAFANFKLFANILGISEELVERFRTILISLSCQLPLDSTKFGKYCSDTAELYVSLYDWYPMPATVHKVLIHGQEIVQFGLLPVGMYGEDAAESRNKLYRRFRERHSRKLNRIACLMDVFYRSMDSSDPYMTHLRQQFGIMRRKRLPLPESVLDLLQPHEEVEGERELTHEDIEGETEFFAEDDEVTEDEMYADLISLELSAELEF